jgi:glutathione S-transferase
MHIVGRTGSLFTRVARIVAHELEVPVELVLIKDMTDTNPAVYAGNPALKLPILRRPSGDVVLGTANICRVLAESSSSRIVFPEHFTTDLARNLQEMTDHAMQAQVQRVFGTIIAKNSSENVYFAKGRAGFLGALAFLEEHVDARPRASALTYLDVTLFCLVEHVRFRGTVELARYPRLTAFARTFAERSSAKATEYRLDA